MTNYTELKIYRKSQVNGLTKHLSGLRWGKDESRDLTIQRAEEIGLQVDYNDSHITGEKFTFKTPRKITAEQTRFGKAWLKNHFFKLDGSPRKGQATQYVNQWTLDIAKSVSRFEFIGVLGIYSPDYRDFNQFIPIYRAYNRKGEYFDYAPVHWGQPVIFNEGGAK